MANGAGGAFRRTGLTPSDVSAFFSAADAAVFNGTTSAVRGSSAFFPALEIAMNRTTIAARALNLFPAAALVAIVGCHDSTPPHPADPSQVSGSNAAAMGKLRTPGFDQMALKDAQLQRDKSAAGDGSHQTATATATDTAPTTGTSPSRTTTDPQGVAPLPNNARTDGVAAGAAAGANAPTTGSTTPSDEAAKTHITAMDQSSDPGDLRITQDIRKALVSDPTLSLAAKNVTVVTIRGRVTLVGTVKDYAERSNVAAKAKRYAGEGRVDDRLQMKQ